MGARVGGSPTEKLIMSNIPPISDPNRPPSSPPSRQRQKPKLSAEARAWMGLEPADFPIYAAMGGAFSLFYVVNVPLELLISLASLALGTFSCILGMRAKPEFSRLTNAMKLIGYPAGMLVVVMFIALNFLSWNPNPQAGFFPRWMQR